MNKLEASLNEIKNDIKAIRQLLELNERSKLTAALRDLLHIEDVQNPEHKNQILFNSKNVLAPISLKYKELLEGAKDIDSALAFEEYFCLTSLAHARCLAELGMFELAHKDLKNIYDFWAIQSRKITNELLLEKQPERFLYGVGA